MIYIQRTATVLIGPHKDEHVLIMKIEFDAGAINGWFTVKFQDGTMGLYAGQELSK